MKPIGYYTNYTPGDEGLLDEMQSAWGAQLQELNNIDRLWMIYKLAEELCAEFEEALEIEDLTEGVEEAVERSNSELQQSDRLGLIEALVNQVKHSK
ncbi:hypothetical protein [Calothrix sp. UHCC 0171]|uniref:hypothetical protein n=1 Tax=Calothrix sp. UHCC 0171 TaxID=3110245 RepID=UPI002B1FF8BC|nr:hypothetical protein [Calothrix sp. UHCC 0171]MEA5574170.1 hypothetical protein [Calothrix sp. UHCC 0171]